MSKGGGEALKREIHVARNRAGITSDMRLAIASGVHYDTLMNWFSERTVPRPAELKKVAEAMGASYSRLMDAYEGREPEPTSIEEALRRHTDAVETQNGLLRVLVSALHDGALSVTLALTPGDEEGRARKMAKAAIDAEQRESAAAVGDDLPDEDDAPERLHRPLP